MGPLRFTPSLVISNVGVDNNVFNEAEDPKRDTTAAVGPAVNLWLRMGRARLTGKTSGQYLYFKNYSNQRSWNTADELGLELRLARLKPFAKGTYANTNDRPGFEIDARALHRDVTGTLGSELRISSKTTLVLGGTAGQTRYDREERFLGSSLADALNRSTTTEQLQLRYAMTPLTTFLLTTDAIQDRFEVSTTRNADSLRVMTGFEFKPVALISGKVGVGFRHFNALSDETTDFDGIVASTDAKYSIAATQFQVQWRRDVEYSYGAFPPYYVLNDFGLTLTQRATRTWDFVARGGWQTLAYRDVASSDPVGDRTDHGSLYGAGIGYRVGETLRLGIDANYYRRDSQVLGVRNYEGMRIGASFSYGLPQ